MHPESAHCDFPFWRCSCAVPDSNLLSGCAFVCLRVPRHVQPNFGAEPHRLPAAGVRGQHSSDPARAVRGRVGARVFRFTGPSNWERHLQAAEAFGVDISNAKRENAGELLGEAISRFLDVLDYQPCGLRDPGFGHEHSEELVDTIPQARPA